MRSFFLLALLGTTALAAPLAQTGGDLDLEITEQPLSLGPASVSPTIVEIDGESGNIEGGSGLLGGLGNLIGSLTGGLGGLLSGLSGGIGDGSFEVEVDEGPGSYASSFGGPAPVGEVDVEVLSDGRPVV
jgi:hypothetical protein